MENEVLSEAVMPEPEAERAECEAMKNPAVAVRFALGRSRGIHLALSPTPKNLREAKNAAIRYCKTRG